jgi:Sec-independent protein translocase protein TatA
MLYVAIALIALIIALILFVIFGGPKLPPETDAIH